MRISVGCAAMNKFKSGARAYIDANIFIYFMEGDDAFVQKAADLFARLGDAEAELTTNELTCAECLYKPAKDGNQKAIDAYEQLFSSGEIDLLPLDGVLAKTAAMHGGALGLKLPDAIHYLCALEAGCDYFITADAQFKSGPKMKVVGLDG